jgi:hypothetical protein
VTPRIIPRSQWGARFAPGPYTRPVGRLERWLHHTVTVAPDTVPPFTDDYAAWRAVEAITEQRFGWGIAYSFGITPAGLIFEGHPIDRVGAHTQGHNTAGVGIALVGNYENAKPTRAQLEALTWLLHEGVRRGWWTSPTLSGGHRDTKATACPGRHAYALIPDVDRGVYRTGEQPATTPNRPAKQEYQLMRHLNLKNAAAKPVEGRHVKTLQAQLLAWGHGPAGLVDAGGHPDGVAGAATRRELGKFQRRTDTGNRDGTPDYLVYEGTWQALLGLD